MSINYPYYKILLWRLLRGAVGTAISQTIVFSCGSSNFDIVTCVTHITAQWGNAKAAAQMIAISFVSGFFVALGLAIRDYLSKGNQNSAFNKLPL